MSRVVRRGLAPALGLVIVAALGGCSGEPGEPQGSSSSSDTSSATSSGPQDPLAAAFRAARNASHRATLLDVSRKDSQGDDVASRNARAGLSEAGPPHYIEPPPGVEICFVTGEAWLATHRRKEADPGTVALGEGSRCPSAGPNPRKPFPDAEVVGRIAPNDYGPGRWLRGEDRVEPFVPNDLSDTRSAEFEHDLTSGQLEAFDLARGLLTSLEVFAANNPGRPLPRPEDLAEHEPWGFEAAAADRIKDYRVSGSTVRFCALGADGAWASVSSEDDVVATGPSGEECATS